MTTEMAHLPDPVAETFAEGCVTWQAKSGAAQIALAVGADEVSRLLELRVSARVLDDLEQIKGLQEIVTCAGKFQQSLGDRHQ